MASTTQPAFFGVTMTPSCRNLPPPPKVSVDYEGHRGHVNETTIDESDADAEKTRFGLVLVLGIVLVGSVSAIGISVSVRHWHLSASASVSVQSILAS